ncbi:TonB-dependent receptor family protein [Dokdonia pacifica]|uniref:Iron complex outermembrane recepter protein n=1 Tax=Dokdonia pacifica TaxID=1627892 RepID=A0A238W0I9_9FLAO|nr:TonB-dependent receptor [Dokdonia pacifica]SNR40008.1 iron complex outermembrane recepter protein [Dokdonia pacifica]
MKKILLSTVGLCMCMIHLSYSQTDSIPSQKLDTVFLQSSRIISTLQKIPATVSVYQTTQDDATRQQLSLQEFTQQSPGLFAQNTNNFAQDLRISIRGFGARSAFGIRGIKLIVDGIPETTPDGQGQLDNLTLGIIDRIEIVKGPSSSLYGNASGGVIDIQTIDEVEKPFSHWKGSVGSYGFQNFQATGGINSENATYIFHGNYVASDGYRDQSGFKQVNTNFKAKFDISDRLTIRTLLNYSDSPEADDPGSLTLEAVQENRRQARDRNVLFETGETIRQFKVGISTTWIKNKFTSIDGYLFYNNRQFDGKLPFEFGGIVDLGRDYVGQGASITYAKGKNTLKAGYDFAYQNDDRQRFRNLEGTQGDQTLDQKERFTNLGIYITDHLEIDKWYITGGIRFDYNKLTADDAFLSNGDDSDDITLNAVNPSVGVNYAFAKTHNVYTNFSTSFETPALSELSANPNGDQGFNEGLEAQKATNYEIGFKGQFANAFRYQVAVFRIDTRDDLVPFELEAFPDRTFFRNAGKTARNGVEVEGVYAFAKAWTVSAAYAYSDFTYSDFTTPNGTFDGNALPGIPKHVGNISLQYHSEKGFYAGIQTAIVGLQYANDSNEAEVEGYENINVRGGYDFIYKNVIIQPYIGINNLLDQEYTDNVRINAFGGRFFEPAPGFNGYGGVVVKI